MFTRDNIHHAYIIEGEKGAICTELFRTLEKEFKIERQGNPDFFYEEFESLGIDDGRRIKEMQANAGFTGTKKIFVIITHTITNEAQNSLLKVFEEPTQNTHFFIIVPTVAKLLSTFKSRAHIIKHGTTEQNGGIQPEVFVSSSVPKRLSMLKEIIESKDKEKAEQFLKSLATYMMKKSDRNQKIDKVDAFQSISKALLYIGDRSSSVKLILENIALTL